MAGTTKGGNRAQVRVAHAHAPMSARKVFGCIVSVAPTSPGSRSLHAMTARRHSMTLRIALKPACLHRLLAGRCRGPCIRIMEPMHGAPQPGVQERMHECTARMHVPHGCSMHPS